MKFEKYLLLLRIAWKNVFTKKERNINFIIIYGVALASIFFLYAFSNGLIKNIEHNLRQSINGHINIKKDSSSVKEDEFFSYDELKINELKIDNFFEIYQQIELKGIVKNQKGMRSVKVLTINDMRNLKNSYLKEDEIISYDPDLFDNNGLIISHNINKTIDAEMGLKIILSIDDPFVEVGLKVAGFYESKIKDKDKVYIFIKKKNLEKLLSRPGKMNQLSLIMPNEDEEKLKDILKSLQQNLKNFQVTYWREQYPIIDGFTNLINRLSLLFTNVVFLSLMFILIGTIIISLNEKTRDFYILYTIGFKKMNIVLIQLFETILLLIFSFILSGLVIYFLLSLGLKNGINMESFKSGLQTFYLDPVLIPIPLFSDFIFLLQWLALMIVSTTIIMTIYKVKGI